ncbi:MAG: NosD domain-containing protein, partial [Candidatus Methanospirareceae archaeon]
LTLWLAFSGVAAAEQLYVNESGWWRDGGVFNVSTAPIQAAVGAADAGDSIYVWNGSYTDNVNVNKQLTLEGEGMDVVTVSMEDPGDHVFEVTADYVNLSGFTARGATDDNMAGIYLDNVDYCNISENNVYVNCFGIKLDSLSNNNTLTNNTASDNRVGIYLYRSNNNTLTNNTASDNIGTGIYMDSSSNYNTLTNNTA